MLSCGAGEAGEAGARGEAGRSLSLSRSGISSFARTGPRRDHERSENKKIDRCYLYNKMSGIAKITSFVMCLGMKC